MAKQRHECDARPRLSVLILVSERVIIYVLAQWALKN